MFNLFFLCLLEHFKVYLSAVLAIATLTFHFLYLCPLMEHFCLSQLSLYFVQNHEKFLIYLTKTYRCIYNLVTCKFQREFSLSQLILTFALLLILEKFKVNLNTQFTPYTPLAIQQENSESFLTVVCFHTFN